jgi:LemA protein
VAFRQLLAVAESYPELKANQNFLALQEELTGDRVEDRVLPAVLQTTRCCG